MGWMVFCLACVAGIVAVLLYARLAPRPSSPRSVGGVDLPTELISSVPQGPFVLFANGAPGSLFGRVAIEKLPLGTGPRPIAPLACERVHYAAGIGVCMTTDESRLPARSFAELFDASFKRTHVIPLTGSPIRARVSPDGRRAALTVFETGHSYSDASFSTRTIVIETASGRSLGDLEDFTVRKDGVPFKAIDFNFWGVTFGRDGDTFYATLKTGGERYLIKGSIDARAAAVVRTGVECPSLSPDGTLIVFKKPLTQEVGWRLHVLDLASGVERPLNQVRRSVDDQVDWFDASHVVYHDSAPEGSGVWLLAVDGVSGPRLLVPYAHSPAVAREPELPRGRLPVSRLRTPPAQSGGLTGVIRQWQYPAPASVKVVPATGLNSHW